MNGICFRSVSNCFFVVVVVVVAVVAVAAEGSASWRSRIRARWTKCWRRRRTNSTARRSTPKLHSRAGRIPKWVPMRIIYFKQKKTRTHTHSELNGARLVSVRGLTGFFCWFLGFTGFYWVFLGFYWILLGFTGLTWVLLFFSGFFLGFTWVILGLTGFVVFGFYWGL